MTVNPTHDLRKALEGIADDYMTSEQHHPGYVLIPTTKFEQLRTASEALSVSTPTGEGEARESLKPFVAHYQPWMDDWADDDPCGAYARVTFGDLRRARAVISAPEGKATAIRSFPSDPSQKPLGYYFHNPDSGWEVSDSHPITSGECEDATEIEQLTPALLKELLLQAWDDAEELRAERDDAALAHPQQGGEREREIEAVAEHLHEERDYDRQWTWPTHPKDDGYRGHNHRLTITPPDVQARLREEAGRILTRVDQLRRPTAPTSPSESSEETMPVASTQKPNPMIEAGRERAKRCSSEHCKDGYCMNWHAPHACWVKPGPYVADEHGTPITGLSWCAAQPHEKNTSHCPACGVGPLEACRGRVPQDDEVKS